MVLDTLFDCVLVIKTTVVFHVTSANAPCAEPGSFNAFVGTTGPSILLVAAVANMPQHIQPLEGAAFFVPVPKLSSSLLPAFFAAQNNQHVGGVAVVPETSAAAQHPLAAPSTSQPHGGNSARAFISRAGICYSPGGEAARARCG